MFLLLYIAEDKSMLPQGYKPIVYNPLDFASTTGLLTLQTADLRYNRRYGINYASDLYFTGNLYKGGSLLNLDIVSGVTAGISQNSKVLSLNSSGVLDKLTLDGAGTGLDTPSLKFSGTTFDQTMYLSITKGGAAASKAMVLNSTLDFSGVNTFGCSTLTASTSLSSPSITTNSITFSAGTKTIQDVSIIDFNSTSFWYKTVMRKSSISGSGGIEFYDTQLSNPKALVNMRSDNNSDPVFLEMRGWLNDGSIAANGWPAQLRWVSGQGLLAGINLTVSNTSNSGAGVANNVVLSTRNATIPHVVCNDQKNQLHLWPQGLAELNTSYVQNVICGEEMLIRKCLCVGTSQDTARMISCLDSTMTSGTARYLTLGYDNSSRNQAEISFYYNGYNDTGNRIDFGFYGGALMYLTAAGRLGIGTSSPRAGLEVAAALTSWTQNSFTTNTYSYDVSSNSWSNRGTGPFTLSNLSGWFNGNVHVANGLWNTSDRRLKEDIKSIDMDIERYKLLNPVSYRYKNDSKTKLGFIAQEMLHVCGEAISMSPNENLKAEQEDDIEGVQLGLDYNTITVLNVDIMKKMIDRVEQLEALVDKLVARPVVARWLAKSSP